jgi:hypothetical protein
VSELTTNVRIDGLTGDFTQAGLSMGSNVSILLTSLHPEADVMLAPQ